MMATDVSEWRITFVTGIHSAIGKRLRRFLASDDVGAMLAVRAEDSLHVLRPTADWHVTGIVVMRVNGGGFAHRPEIPDFQREGEDRVTDICVRAVADGRVHAVPYDGLLAPMDTVQERPAREERPCLAMSSWAPWHTSTAASAGSSDRTTSSTCRRSSARLRPDRSGITDACPPV
jgi:hypothetical protein